METPAPTTAAPRRIGVLGGSFNPIHHAHLFTAEVAAASFGLDRVLLVPAAQSPLKRHATVRASDRVAMVRLAAAGNALLEVSTIDVDRPAPSYTVDTIALLQEAHPGAEFCLILGIDALQDLLEWREPERLLELCRVIVVSRPGFPLTIPAPVSAALGPRAARILLQPMPELAISSTDIRRRLGWHEPVRYLLPESVARYIHAHALYRGLDDGGPKYPAILD